MKHCKYCGNELISKLNFCQSCGKSVSTDESGNSKNGNRPNEADEKKINLSGNETTTSKSRVEIRNQSKRKTMRLISALGAAAILFAVILSLLIVDNGNEVASEEPVAEKGHEKMYIKIPEETDEEDHSSEADVKEDPKKDEEQNQDLKVDKKEESTPNNEEPDKDSKDEEKRDLASERNKKQDEGSEDDQEKAAPSKAENEQAKENNQKKSLTSKNNTEQNNNSENEKKEEIASKSEENTTDKKNESNEKKEAATASAKSGKTFRVQVGAFEDKGNADNLVSDLTKKGYNPSVKVQDNLYKIQIEASDSEVNAEEILGDLEKNGYSAYISN